MGDQTPELNAWDWDTPSPVVRVSVWKGMYATLTSGGLATIGVVGTLTPTSTLWLPRTEEKRNAIFFWTAESLWVREEDDLILYGPSPINGITIVYAHLKAPHLDHGNYSWILDRARQRVYAHDVSNSCGIHMTSALHNFEWQSMAMEPCSLREVRVCTDGHHLFLSEFWERGNNETISLVNVSQETGHFQHVWKHAAAKRNFRKSARVIDVVDHRWIWMLFVESNKNHGWRFSINVFSLVDGQQLDYYTINGPWICNIQQPCQMSWRNKYIYSLHWSGTSFQAVKWSIV
jgi:hypothetical protein